MSISRVVQQHKSMTIASKDHLIIKAMDELQKIHWLQECLVIDTSEGQTVYLLAVGTEPTYIRLSPTSYYLLQQRSMGVSFEELAKALSQQGKQVSTTAVRTAYNKVVGQIGEIERNPKIDYSSFLFRQTLIPKRVVNFIASYLSWAFYKPVAYCLLALIAVAVAIAPRDGLLLNISPIDVLWGYGLFLGSLLMHELGHASACKRYGAQPNEIGFTVYLIWPAFYSNVTAAWSLKRWQRVVVDIGGVFFQLVVAAGYVLAYILTSWTALKLALLLVASSCIFAINPVFKSDGYWVVADSLGVTNLAEQRSRIVKHVLNRHRPTNALPWSPAILSVLALYTVVSFAIWGYFLWKILPLFWKIFLEYPALLSALVPKLFHWPPTLEMDQFQSFLGSTFMVIVGGLMLQRLCKLIFVVMGVCNCKINSPKRSAF